VLASGSSGALFGVRGDHRLARGHPERSGESPVSGMPGEDAGSDLWSAAEGPFGWRPA
jgi:hypothetical protein